jgi:hypothetical protein
VVVHPDFTLISGERRLEAVKELGWSEVPIRIVHGLDDALKVLRAERDENTCRKDLTLSEAGKLGSRLEEVEREAARARQEATQAKKGQKIGGQGAGKFPAPSTGRTADRVGAAVGLSGKTYRKVKTVLDAAEKQPKKFGPLTAEMDRTGKVDGAFKKLRAAKAAEKEAAKTEKQREQDRIKRGQEAWEKMMEGQFQIVNSIHRMGGIGILVAGWGRDKREEFVGCFDQLIEELQSLRNELRRLIDEGR